MNSIVPNPGNLGLRLPSIYAIFILIGASVIVILALLPACLQKYGA